MDEELERAAREAFLKRLARRGTKDLEITVEGEPVTPQGRASPGFGSPGPGSPAGPGSPSSPGSAAGKRRTFRRQPRPHPPSAQPPPKEAARGLGTRCGRASARAAALGRGRGLTSTCSSPRPSTRCTLGGLTASTHPGQPAAPRWTLPGPGRQRAESRGACSRRASRTAGARRPPAAPRWTCRHVCPGGPQRTCQPDRRRVCPGGTTVDVPARMSRGASVDVRSRTAGTFVPRHHGGRAGTYVPGGLSGRAGLAAGAFVPRGHGGRAARMSRGASVRAGRSAGACVPRGHGGRAFRPGRPGSPPLQQPSGPSRGQTLHAARPQVFGDFDDGFDDVFDDGFDDGFATPGRAAPGRLPPPARRQTRGRTSARHQGPPPWGAVEPQPSALCCGRGAAPGSGPRAPSPLAPPRRAAQGGRSVWAGRTGGPPGLAPRWRGHRQPAGSGSAGGCRQPARPGCSGRWALR
jgi:hypothetical protein